MNNMKVNETGKTGYVKCQICGEVFEAGKTVCPVCGMGPEHFVPVEREAAAYRNDTNREYVILGSGRAAVSAAEAIRERDTSGSITMISAEKELPYTRPMLTKQMFAELGTNPFAFCEEEWFEKQRVRRVAGTITELNAAEKKVVLEDGSVYPYDKCVYALGAHFFVPPFGGREDPRVTTLRTLEDLTKLRALLEAGKEAAVIGGGVVGLEAAWELQKYGCNVTVFEAGPSLMSGRLDPVASRLLQSLVEESGVRVVANAAVQKYENGAVVLADGAEFPANMVLVSCGVRANGALAAAAGVALGRAILVNDRMETNVPDVYAAGDCAEFEGVNYALWPEADAQGKVAGANACGDEAQYVSEVYGMSIHLCNTEVYAIGRTGGGEDYFEVEKLDEGRKTLKKYFFLEGILKGATLIGDTRELARVTDWINRGATYGEVVYA